MSTVGQVWSQAATEPNGSHGTVPQWPKIIPFCYWQRGTSYNNLYHWSSIDSIDSIPLLLTLYLQDSYSLDILWHFILRLDHIFMVLFTDVAKRLNHPWWATPRLRPRISSLSCGRIRPRFVSHGVPRSPFGMSCCKEFAKAFIFRYFKVIFVGQMFNDQKRLVYF